MHWVILVACGRPARGFHHTDLCVQMILKLTSNLEEVRNATVNGFRDVKSELATTALNINVIATSSGNLQSQTSCR